MNIVVIGPPGCGKGTHTDALSKAFNLFRISTGNLFRRHYARSTKLGEEARSYMQAGELVPDRLVQDMVRDHVTRERDEVGYLFDGFPRTCDQVAFLDDLLADDGREIDAAIYLNVADEENERRLLGRLICRSCQTRYHRDDKPPKLEDECDLCAGELYQRESDSTELIRARLRVFKRVTRRVLEKYQHRNKLIILDGNGTAEDVYTQIRDAVGAIDRKETPSWVTPEELDAVMSLLDPEAGVDAPAAKESCDLVLLGAPGSGKGTQAEHVCREMGLPHIATGDLFRENLKNETELGLMAKSYMDRGELVPDEVTDAMVKDRLSRPDTEKGFVLDGYPRNLKQAETLSEIELSMGRSISGAIYIKVADEEIVNRLSGRLICRDCQTPFHKMFKPSAEDGNCSACGGELYQRDDDNPATVGSRLEVFHAQTEPVVEFFRKMGVLDEINGEGDVSEVTRRTLAAAGSGAEA